MDSIDKTFIKALFTANYYRAYKALEEYVLEVIFRVLHEMNITDYLQKDYRTVDEIVDRFNFHAQSKPLLNWMLTYLNQMGYLQNGDLCYLLKADPSDMHTKNSVSEIAALMPTANIFIQLARHVERGIKDFLMGRKNGRDILISNNTVSALWNDYFNNNFYGYSTLNYCTAYGMTKWFSQTEGKSMLEVGSGTCGATIKVFQMLRDNNLLDSMDSIVLSDIVPSLLDLGSRNISRSITSPPRYEQRLLDISLSLREQGFLKDSIDIVYGVNVFHVANDLSFSLREVYDHLNKNGLLILTETIRPVENRALHHEIIFDLFDNYYNVKLDAIMRPYHGFLTKERWVKYFEMAGFKNIEDISELNRHEELDFDILPLHSVLVLKGQKC